MMDNNELDQLFQSKLKERSFAFTPSSWAGAEQLIVADEKGQRFWKFFWASFAMLMLLGVAALLWPSQQPVEYIAGNDKIGTTPQKLNTEMNQQGSAVTALVDSDQNEENGTELLEITPAVEDVSASNTSGKVSSRQSKKELKSTKKASPKNQPVQVGATPKREKSKVAEKVEQIKEAIKGGVAAIKPGPSRKATDLNKMMPVDKRTSSTLASTESLEKPAGWVAPMHYNAFSGFASNRNTEAEATEPGLEALQAEALKKLKLKRPVSFGFVLGTQVSRGFRNNAPKAASASLGIIGGVTGQLHYLHNVTFDVSVLYQTRGGTNGTNSFFEAANNLTTVSPMRLHYIDVPLYFNWRVHQRHAVLIGIQHSFLVNVRSEVTKTVFDNESGEVLDEKVSSEWGGKDGFSSYDLGVTVGYQYAWDEWLNIGWRANIGAFDVTDNAYFQDESDKKDLNTQFKVFVTAPLFR